MPDWLEWALDNAPKIVTVFALGGAAGALLTEAFTRRRQKLELAIRVVEAYFARYQRLGYVKDLLQNGVPDDQHNAVLEIGDWLNLVAKLNNKKALNAWIVESVGITKEIAEFGTNVGKTPLAGQTSKWPDLMDTTRRLG